MSAFTSSMACQLVGRLLVRERLLELVLPRRVGRERVAGRVQPLLVEHDQLLRDLRDLGRAHAALVFGQSPPPSRLSVG